MAAVAIMASTTASRRARMAIHPGSVAKVCMTVSPMRNERGWTAILGVRLSLMPSMTRKIVQHRSPIHGNGVFAATDIPKGTRVTRYRGKILTHEQANRRYGNDVDSGHTFLFTLNEKYLIDANEGGNIARWIN